MSALQTLKAELEHIEARFHDLVAPEQAMARKVGEIVKEAVSEIAHLGERIEALEMRIDALFHMKQTAESAAPAPEASDKPASDGSAEPGAADAEVTQPGIVHPADDHADAHPEPQA